MKIVKVHCGSAHVKGKAREYAYFVASVFETHETKEGSLIWINTGISTNPRRSFSKAEREGRELASEHGCDFKSGYGSLHNKKVA